MASTREKRTTAGNRLNKVLNEEVEADEFYSTTYGGFNEIENDDDYKSEEEGDDVVDSDFSADENDEVVSDQEEDGTKRKKSGITKAYKDPKAVKSGGKAEKRKLDPKSTKSEKKDPAKKVKVDSSNESLERVERKSTRKATVEKSAETAKKIKERSQVKKKIPLKKNEYVKPTQEELLKEAIITEQENIKSLERYQKMELEKKKCRIVKKIYTGPTIKYHSVSMPLIEEIKEVTASSRTISESEISIDVVKTEDSDVDAAISNVDATNSTPVNGNVQVEGADSGETTLKEEAEPSKGNEEKKDDAQITKSSVDKVAEKVISSRCERTFITFSDDQTFKAACPWVESKPQTPPPIKICPFTRQKAKYFDPVSQCPYNTVQAFKILRETYYMQLEKAITNGTVEGIDKEELSKWMAWRTKEKENKLRRLSVLPQNVAQTAPTVVQPATPVTATLPS